MLLLAEVYQFNEKDGSPFDLCVGPGRQSTSTVDWGLIGALAWPYRFEFVVGVTPGVGGTRKRG